MPVSIAEYYGQRTDIDSPVIQPQKDKINCPFMDKPCTKLFKKKPNKPVCSVRKEDGTLWIVCPDRLCSTSKTFKDNFNKSHYLKLNDYQRSILWEISKTLYGNEASLKNVATAREVSIKLDNEAGSYHADYILRNLSGNGGSDKIILEMQGGGETSQTGAITGHIKSWENDKNRSNVLLRQPVKAGTIETNAWRRQQEQFLVKGSVVTQTGGKLVFAVGSLLFDYLQKKIQGTALNDLRNHNWTLCLLAFKEDKSSPPTKGPIPLTIDKEKLIFTDYSRFVRALTDQGSPRPEIFEGNFETLSGEIIKI